MDKYILEFLKYLEVEKGYSKNTIIKYEHIFLKYEEYLNQINSNVINVDYIEMKNYIYALYNLEYAPSTISNYISGLKSLYKFLMSKGYLSENVMENVVFPKKDKRLFKVIYSKELKAFFKAINDHGTFKKRDEVLFKVLYTTGIRISECSNLKFENIDYTEELIKILGKGNKERSVPIKAEVLKLLEEYIIGEREILAKSKQSNYIFLNKDGDKLTDRGIRYLTQKYCMLCSENLNISPHAFRHTLATTLLNNGMNLRSIQTILGHESLATTEKYTHLSKEDMKNQYNLLIER